MQLGQLSRQRDASLRQRFRHTLERLADSKRRLEGYRGSRVVAQRLHQPAHLAGLARQIAEKGKAGSSVPRYRERGGDRARPRDRDHGVARRPGGRDQGLSWVGQGRRAGVADQRDVALVESGHHARQPAPLDRRSIADQWFANAIPGKQARGHARVLGGDRGDLTQDAQRACAHILEVADRRSYHKEVAQTPSNQAPTLSATSLPGPTYREAGGRMSRKALP